MPANKRKLTKKELDALSRLKEIIISFVIIFIAIMIFFADSSSVIWWYIVKYSELLFSDLYKLLISPVLLVFGFFILTKRSELMNIIKLNLSILIFISFG